jgi:hypothetical protein
MAGITSDQLMHILDLNSKSVEMNLEVSNQYDEVLILLKAIKTDYDLNKSETNLSRQRLDINIGSLIVAIENNKKALDEHTKQVESSLNKIDKAILRQDVVLGGSVIAIILAIISKFLFGV